MRKLESLLGAAMWIAVAVLMPLAALEPVSAAREPARTDYAVSLCADGEANLAMGCESIHL